MKNSQKGFIVPVLLAIIALSVIGGGVYLYKNKKTETPVVDTAVQQVNTKTPTVATPKNETINIENAINQYAYITKFYNQNGQNFIDADYVDVQILKDGPSVGHPAVINTNPQIRSLKVSNQIKIEDRFTNAGIGVQMEYISLNELETRLARYEKNSPGKKLYVQITAENGVINLISIPWRP